MHFHALSCHFVFVNPVDKSGDNLPFREAVLGSIERRGVGVGADGAGGRPRPLRGRLWGNRKCQALFQKCIS